MTEEKTQEVDEQLQQRHVEPRQATAKDDILSVAKLFNTVGSELTKVQSHKVDGNVQAMQLEKGKVFRSQTDEINMSINQKPPPPPATVPPPVQVQQVSPPQPGPPPPSLQTTTVSVGVKEYEQQKKTITALKRKITKLEKEIQELGNILSIDNKQVKYKIATSNIECTCNSITTLMSMLATELQNKPTDITISKC